MAHLQPWKFLRSFDITISYEEANKHTLTNPTRGLRLCKRAALESSRIDLLKLICGNSLRDPVFSSLRSLIVATAPRLRVLQTPFEVPSTKNRHKEFAFEMDPNIVEDLSVAIGYVSPSQMTRLLRAGCPKLYRLVLHSLYDGEEILEMLQAIKEANVPNLVSLGFSFDSSVERVEPSFLRTIGDAVKPHAKRLRCLHLPDPYWIQMPSFPEHVLGAGMRHDPEAGLEDVKQLFGDIPLRAIRFGANSVISFASPSARSLAMYDEWYSSPKLFCGLTSEEEAALRSQDLSALVGGLGTTEWRVERRDKLLEHFGDLYHNQAFAGLCCQIVNDSDEVSDLLCFMRCLERNVIYLPVLQPSKFVKIIRDHFDWAKIHLDANDDKTFQACRVAMNYVVGSFEHVIALLEFNQNLKPTRPVELMKFFFQIQATLDFEHPAILRFLNMANARNVKYDTYVTWDTLSKIFSCSNPVQEAFACFIPWKHAISNVNVTLERLAPIKRFVQLHFKNSEKVDVIPTSVLHEILFAAWSRAARSMKTEEEVNQWCESMKEFCQVLHPVVRDAMNGSATPPAGLSASAFSAIVAKYYNV
jgi:hypothetical protein